MSDDTSSHVRVSHLYDELLYLKKLSVSHDSNFKKERLQRFTKNDALTETVMNHTAVVGIATRWPITDRLDTLSILLSSMWQQAANTNPEEHRSQPKRPTNSTGCSRHRQKRLCTRVSRRQRLQGLGRGLRADRWWLKEEGGGYCCCCCCCVAAVSHAVVPASARAAPFRHPSFSVADRPVWCPSIVWSSFSSHSQSSTVSAASPRADRQTDNFNIHKTRPSDDNLNRGYMRNKIILK